MSTIVTVEKRDELDEALLEVGMSIKTGDEICDKAMEEANDMNVNDSELIVIKLENDPADLSMTVFEVVKDEDNPAIKKLSFREFHFF
ncbi:hypothetical protein J14TS2_22150 [Bacillus sp. J14TS2]|uniref:hypothetical protein n=1 Tax=Bacillus sp. J14TS2 TaxID=2807188 RepID=UPI001B0BA47F|nr:hypothetical protein [Bacillus sp. J14TS2]GIN71740.1 hypothetical protein J14TS2_22150 [Bacillus sp. J14TS2]